MTQDTKETNEVQLTEERVREIVREEIERRNAESLRFRFGVEPATERP